MAKLAQDYESKNRNYYAAAISLFAALSMTTQFVSYVLEVDITKRLFDQFASKAFEWATYSQAHFSLLEIINLGIITFALVLCLIFVFSHPKLDGKQSYGNLTIVLIYLGIFIIYGYVSYPVSIQRPFTWIWAIAFAIVCGASAHLVLLHGRLRKKRREVDTSQFSEGDHRWQFLRQVYNAELAEYRGLLHDLIWIGGSICVLLVFSSILQYTFSLPSEIAFSNEFNIIIIIVVIKMLILFFGMIGGVLHQLASEMHDIADLIRSKSK
jgi:hypothetical protein